MSLTPPTIIPQIKTSITKPKTTKKFLMLMLILITIIWSASGLNGESSQSHMKEEIDELEELLHTEAVLIDYIRLYIKTLEEKIAFVKRETAKLNAELNVARNDTAKYVGNPINCLNILKRSLTDWNVLHKYAGDRDAMNGILKNLKNSTKLLRFPDEIDYDVAVGNLLRIQDIYDLKPQNLAVGELNGVKVGAEMTWSDCLAVGQKSAKNGDYIVAKYWMETALGKLPTVTNDTSEAKAKVILNAKFDVLGGLLNTEYHAGNLETALHISEEMLQLKPHHNSVLKGKRRIKNMLYEKCDLNRDQELLKNKKKKNPKQKKNKKSAEELLIEEVCRDISQPKNNYENTHTSITSTKYCSLVHGNLGELFLQPIKVEYLSLEPYIVVYHDVLSLKEIDSLKNLLEYQETEMADEYDDVVIGSLQFTSMAKRKLARFNRKLEKITGHASALFGKWRVERQSFEDNIDSTRATAANAEAHNDAWRQRTIVAKVLFSLQESQLGGSIVFPQLELTENVPLTSLLYWSNLDEFQEPDYRTKQSVCPVIAGTQLLAISAITKPRKD